MAQWLLYTIAGLTLASVIAITLIGYGESRAAHRCASMFEVSADFNQE